MKKKHRQLYDYWKYKRSSLTEFNNPIIQTILGLLIFYLGLKMFSGGMKSMGKLEHLEYFIHNPYYMFLGGIVCTLLWQSSSLSTTAIIGLVASGALPLPSAIAAVLGANIGTTCTAILASLVTESTDAIQIAICHFIFNIMGIIIWFPLPMTRKIPLKMAHRLGELVSKYKWFGVFYILYLFVLIPGASWGVSNMLILNTASLVCGILILCMMALFTFLFFKRFEKVVDTIRNYGTSNKSRHSNRNIIYKNYDTAQSTEMSQPR